VTAPSYRLGVDIGGTFTDAILFDERSGDIMIAKVPSVPSDPSLGFLAVTDRILTRKGVDPSEVRYTVHGTTVATNAIIEGKTARTALVTTEGFSDVLEIGRQTRPVLYDLRFTKPRPLVPRDLCFGVPERMDAGGRVLRPLDETAVMAIADEMRAGGIEAVALCFLHAYRNAAHEEEARAVLARMLPGVPLSTSSDVSPEIDEYRRACTTVINAGVQPLVGRYLDSIGRRLGERGFRAALLVMQSNGGLMTFPAAAEKPVFMIESGPAAGAVAAAYVGEGAGYQNVVSFDMGGTTAKVALILNGHPRVTKNYEVGTTAHAGVGSAKGSGYPIATPVIDLVEIGAGGGSIAWVDSGGALRVGPMSAGADPGPACYGKGGDRPTITDANLVLGRLNPDYFLGGEMPLSVEKAQQAIEERCARPLGLDVVTAALAIVEVANTAMINALRLVTVQRGYDPSELALVAFGGAGPVHANRLAAEAGVPLILVPPSPGLTSALGLLVTDLRHEYAHSFMGRLDSLDAGLVREQYRTLEERGREALARDGISPADRLFLRHVDLRYLGQNFPLTIMVPEAAWTPSEIARIATHFHIEHERNYGYRVEGEPIELVNLRLTAIGRIEKPRRRHVAPRTDGDQSSSVKAYRRVYFEEAGGFIECSIHDRYHLPAGSTLRGPLVVEELDSTIVVHPGFKASVDGLGNLLIAKD
jgi:N-methylhydantoinase A